MILANIVFLSYLVGIVTLIILEIILPEKKDDKLSEVSTIFSQSIMTALKEVDNNDIIEYDSIEDMFDSVGW